VLSIILLIAGAALVAFGIVLRNAWGWGNLYIYGALSSGLIVLGTLFKCILCY